jgi:hypothetical protein
MDSLRKRPLLAFIRRLGADRLTPEELNRARWNRVVDREVARERQAALAEASPKQRREWQAAVLATRRPGS